MSDIPGAFSLRVVVARDSYWSIDHLPAGFLRLWHKIPDHPPRVVAEFDSSSGAHRKSDPLVERYNRLVEALNDALPAEAAGHDRIDFVRDMVKRLGMTPMGRSLKGD